MIELEIALLTDDPALQMRTAGIDPGAVTDYAEAMEAGDEFPAITVFTDTSSYWVADGFHRVAAARKVGKSSISADVRQGNRRDAILFATGVNAKHGLRRTQADKRKSILTVLQDPEWSRMSDREIGKRCWVDHKTVGSVRRELTSGEIPAQSKSAALSRGGEIPAAVEQTGGASMVERLLAKASDEALLAECRRRGLEVFSNAA